LYLRCQAWPAWWQGEASSARGFSEDELQAFLENLDEACRFQRLPLVLRMLLLTLQRRSELALLVPSLRAQNP
jgi:integrase